MKNFDIRKYLSGNKFELDAVSNTANRVSKSYNDIRKTNIDEVKIVNGKFSLTENTDRQLPSDIKRHFLEIISTYKAFSEQMKRPSDIIEIAETLGGVVDAAKTLTLSEAGDWFDTVTIKRNMNELEKLDRSFDKVASEARNLDMRLQALYEDMGNILNRYYEISDIDPAVMKARLGMGDTINESLAKFTLGKQSFTDASLSNEQLYALVKQYVSIPTSKLVSYKWDNLVRIIKDIAALTGKSTINANEKSGSAAKMLPLLKNKIINTEEYTSLYKKLTEILKQLIQYSKKLDPTVGKKSKMAAKLAQKDMEDYFSD